MHADPPACRTVWTLSAAVMVADLVALGLAATWKAMVPGPVPLALEVMEIQPAYSDAFHVQPDCVLTLTVPTPPLSLKEREEGVMV